MITFTRSRVSTVRGSKASKPARTTRSVRSTTQPRRNYSTHESSFSKEMSPQEVYWYVRDSGLESVIVDVRPPEMYKCYRIFNAINIPASTFNPKEIEDIPKEKVVVVYGEGLANHPDVVKVADGIKALGVEQVIKVNGSIDSMREANFMYWLDPEAENERIARAKAAEEEAKKAAAAAKK